MRNSSSRPSWVGVMLAVGKFVGSVLGFWAAVEVFGLWIGGASSKPDEWIDWVRFVAGMALMNVVLIAGWAAFERRGEWRTVRGLAAARLATRRFGDEDRGP